jgi:hypothetical protein
MVSKSRPRDRPLPRRDKAHGKTRPVASSALTKNKKEIKRKKNGGVKPPAAAATSSASALKPPLMVTTRRVGRQAGRITPHMPLSCGYRINQMIDKKFGEVFKKCPGFKQKGKHPRRLSMIYTDSSDPCELSRALDAFRLITMSCPFFILGF